MATFQATKAFVTVDVYMFLFLFARVTLRLRGHDASEPLGIEQFLFALAVFLVFLL